MNDKELHIKKSRERLFKLWVVRTCSYGAFLFIMLSGLDYLATPENFSTFFVYRVLIALLLASVAFIVQETDAWGIGFHRGIATVAIAASAGTIELMILQFGGHDSPYAAGQILLGVCVLGFIPAWMSFHVVSALVIYGIYAVPLLLFGRIERTAMFVSANGFLIAALISSLILRFISERGLDKELSLQYDLLQSEQKYRDLFENAVDPIFEVDADLWYVDANKKATELTGFTKEELLRRTILDMIPPEQVPRSVAEFEKLRQRGMHEKFECKLRTKNGRWLDIEVTPVAIIREGKPAGSQVFVREISERKQR